MVKRFVLGFESWAADCISPIGPAVVEEGIEKLIHYVGETDEGFHILATREDGMSCSGDKAPVSIPLRVRDLIINSLHENHPQHSTLPSVTFHVCL